VNPETPEIITAAHHLPDVSDSDAGGRAGAADRTNDSVTFEEMSLGQRIVIAWMQNTMKGAFLVFMLLFAVSFLVALAFVYPVVAGWLTAGVVLTSLLIGAALYLG
jgi:hypothetical protein